MYVGIVRETFAANELIGTDDKKFTPHLTIAKTTKTSGRKRVKKIEPASYEKHKDEVFGTQIINSLELLSMTLPPDKQGYYHCFSRELFIPSNLSTREMDTETNVESTVSKESSLELLNDRVDASTPLDQSNIVETIADCNQPSSSRMSDNSENASHNNTFSDEHNTTMVETITDYSTSTTDKTKNSKSLTGDGNSTQMTSMPFSAVRFTPRVLTVRKEATKDKVDTRIHADQKITKDNTE